MSKKYSGNIMRPDGVTVATLPISKKLISQTIVFDANSLGIDPNESKEIYICDAYMYAYAKNDGNLGIKSLGYATINPEIRTTGGTPLASLVAEFATQPIKVKGFRFEATDSQQLANPLELLDISADRITATDMITPTAYRSNKQQIENLIDARFADGEEWIWSGNKGMRFRLMGGQKLTLTVFFGEQFGRYE